MNVDGTRVRRAPGKEGTSGLCLGLAVVALLTGVARGGGYGGGTGDPCDPYRIGNINQFVALCATPGDWKAHFKLVADLDFKEVTPAGLGPIGTAQTPFTGVFDGDHHTIANYLYRAGDLQCQVGLFGVVAGPGAVITRLRVRDARVVGVIGSEIGVLVGLQSGGAITRCVIEGGFVQGGEDVGGLAGRSVAVADCCSTADVAGKDKIGGLVGTNTGTITRSASWGTVQGDQDVGGLVGLSGGDVAECYAGGQVKADTYVGGLMGGNLGVVRNCRASTETTGYEFTAGLIGFNAGPVAWCLAAGRVSGSQDTGGLIAGQFGAQAVSNACFWDRETTGQSHSAGGTGQDTQTLFQAKTYLAMGWDFVGASTNGRAGIWCITEGKDYPQLAWMLNNPDFADFLPPAQSWLH